MEQKLRALSAVVGIQTELYPRTWAEVQFRADAGLDESDFKNAVRRAGYQTLKVTIRERPGGVPVARRTPK